MHVNRNLILLWATLLMLVTAGAGAGELSLSEVQRVFPAAQSIAPLNDETLAYSVRSERGQLGYAFTTGELASISAYSGKLINTLVGLGEDGLIVGIAILHHEEPILVIGI